MTADAFDDVGLVAREVRRIADGQERVLELRDQVLDLQQLRLLRVERGDLRLKRRLLRERDVGVFLDDRVVVDPRRDPRKRRPAARWCRTAARVLDVAELVEPIPLTSGGPVHDGARELVEELRDQHHRLGGELRDLLARVFVGEDRHDLVGAVHHLELHGDVRTAADQMRERAVQRLVAHRAAASAAAAGGAAARGCPAGCAAAAAGAAA